MNYQEMSDLEINKSVAKMVLNFDRGAGVPISGTSILQWFDGCEWHKFDPCNSWADAGPIIHENKIVILPDLDGIWTASSGVDLIDDKNPLRAAMIVFLMMKGGE